MGILWRESSQNSIEDCRLAAVTCGSASALFQSSRPLQQLAIEENTEFSLASAAVLRDSYEDNLLCGDQNEEKIVELIDQFTLLMKRRSFQLQKWISNVPGVLKNISEECRVYEATG